MILDWGVWIKAILKDQNSKIPPGQISARFHHTLETLILQLAKKSNVSQVVLSGGCFQNFRLLRGAVQTLEKNGFRVFWPQRFPPTMVELRSGNFG